MVINNLVYDLHNALWENLWKGFVKQILIIIITVTFLKILITHYQLYTIYMSHIQNEIAYFYTLWTNIPSEVATQLSNVSDPIKVSYMKILMMHLSAKLFSEGV